MDFDLNVRGEVSGMMKDSYLIPGDSPAFLVAGNSLPIVVSLVLSSRPLLLGRRLYQGGKKTDSKMVVLPGWEAMARLSWWTTPGPG